MIKNKIERLIEHFYLKLKPVYCFFHRNRKKSHTRKQKLVTQFYIMLRIHAVPSVTYENEHNILQVQSVIARHTVKAYFVNETVKRGKMYAIFLFLM